MAYSRHVHKATGEAGLQQALRRLFRGETPTGQDIKASNTVEFIVCSKPDTGADDAEFMIVYMRDRDPPP